MKRSNNFLKYLAITVIFLIYCNLFTPAVPNALATIINVPSDQPTITDAITAASNGDTIIVAVGTFSENVTLGKSLTLLGAKVGIDARGRVVGVPNPLFESIISPASGACLELLAGSSSSVIDGFSMLGNVTGTNGVIQTLTVALNTIQLNNNYLKVTSTNGQALWFNRSISDVTIDKNEMVGGTTTSQIIYLSNTQSFPGMYLTNNNILGGGGTYGLFTDGNRNVTTSATPRTPLFQGNLFQGLVAGINAGSRSLQDVQILENIFNNNTQLGFQGGPKNCNFARNTFTGNGLYGMSLTAFGSTDPLRGGQGTTIQNNFFSGNATSGGAFGDILLSNQTTGTQNSNLIKNNSLLSAIAIYNNESDGTTDTIHAECNWYGSSSAAVVASKIFVTPGGKVDYTPWLTNGTDDSLGVPGFQPVPGSCNGILNIGLYVNDTSQIGDHYTLAIGNDANPGTPAAPFLTIAHAISVANPNDTIWVDAGTYVENDTINKVLTIYGSNKGTAGFSRVAESIIMPAINDPEAGVLISIQQSNVLIDGFLFNGDNPALSGGYAVGSADVNTSEGITNTTDPINGPFFQIDHINIQNNIFNNFDYQAIYLEVAFNSNHSWNYIKNNKFDNMWEGIQTYAMHTDISHNVFTAVDRAISIHGTNVDCDAGFVPRIARNEVTISWKNPNILTRNVGIWVNYRRGTAPALPVDSNTIHYPTAAPSGRTFIGFYALTITDNRVVTFSNDTLDGQSNCNRGFYMSNCPSSNVTLSGGAFNNIKDIGIHMVNNDPTWGAGDVRLTVNNLPITMAPGAYAGILDSTDNSFALNPFSTDLLVKRLNRKEPTINEPTTSPTAILIAALDISNSTITGGSTGIKVTGTLASANIHDNDSTITGATTGVDVDGGTATLYRNNITANVTGVRVKNSGNLDSITENFITSNSADAIDIEATAGTIGVVSYNNLSGNTGYAINYLKATPTLSATCNWYGTTDSASIAAQISGPVTFVPFLTNGTDDQPAPGFQPVPGSCNGPLPPPADDVGVIAAIPNPSSPVCVGTSVDLTATVKNFGTDTQTVVPVFYKVDAGSPVGPVNTVGPIPQDSTEDVVFTGPFAFTPALPGTYTIKVWTALASDTLPGNDTIQIQIVALSLVSVNPVYIETFTNPVGWTFGGPSGFWTLGTGLVNAAGKTNDTAAKCRFDTSAVGLSGSLRTPPFSFSGMSHPVIHFYVAHRSDINNGDDSMQVLISIDCGVTFTDVPVAYRKANSSVPSLATRPPTSDGWNPDSSIHWRHETIDLVSYANSPNVMIAFRGRSASGNNLFIDDFIATNADTYCTNTVVLPGPYSCNSLISVTFGTVGLEGENITLDNNIGGNTITDNSGGGDLSVTTHLNQNPPSISNPVIAPNSTAFNPGLTIDTPNVVYRDYWFTTTYTGNDKSGYAIYSLSIDVTLFTNTSSLYIVKRADMTAPWVCLNTLLVGDMLIAPGLTTFSDFAVAGDSTQEALPVELSSFASTINRRDVALNWSTASETNNSGFDVERSIENSSWLKVGNVAGNGTTTSPMNYSFTDRNLVSGKYNYRLKQLDFNGNFTYYNLSNEVNVGVPTKFDLSQNYPNPFNPSTKINYDLPFDSKVSIKLFDMSGREVATLVNEVKTAGYYTVNFNGSNLSSGVYFYRISADANGQNFVSTKKLMLIK